MPTLTIENGMQFTTAKSKVTGTIKEIVQNASGSLRIRLQLPDGTERWTTVK